jgi:Tol biopolymer transport system component
MKLKLICCAGLLAALTLTAQSASQSALELQKAIQKESVDGDLRAAISTYRRLATRTTEPDIAAQALLRLAECHEKQGSADARKAYEELLRRYPDRQEAALARQRIATGAPSKTTMVVRKVWDGSRYGNTGSISRDGRYLSFTRWVPDGQLGVYDSQTGQDMDLTTPTSAGYTMAMSAIFSPNAAELAYSWFNVDGSSEIRIVPRTGGSPRTLFKNPTGGSTNTFAWSNDGKRILALISNPTNRLVWISVADASITEVTTLGPCCTPQPGSASLSPDGRFIAFHRKNTNNPADQDVFIISASGGPELPIMAESTREIVLGWSPDGRQLLIGSSRTGHLGAWAVPIQDGKPTGSPTLLKDNLGDRTDPMGFDSKGTFYYTQNPGGFHHVFSAQLNPASGSITSPSLTNAKHLSGTWRPVYSPDGKSLVLTRLSANGGTVPYAAITIDLATGAEKIAISPRSSAFLWRADNTLIAPRGAGFVQVHLDGREPTPIDLTQNPVGNACHGTRATTLQRKLINIDNGAQIPVPTDLGNMLQLSSNCSLVAFTKNGVLSVTSVTPGAAPRELLRLPAGEHFQENTGALTWSSDDRFLYYITYRDVHSDYELWRIPANGGKPVSTGIKMPDLRQLTIHPDGNRIAFTSVRWNYEAWAIDNLLPKRP